MSKIRKIYSPENAGELQGMLGRGLVVMGYYGNTVNMINRDAERGYPPEELQGVMRVRNGHRFIRTPLTYEFFGVVSVYEMVDVTDREVKL